MPNRMYLRVKHRRTSAISSTLRLEGLDSRKRDRDDLVDAISDLRVTSGSNTAASDNNISDAPAAPHDGRRRAAVWRRIELNDNGVDKKRSVHLVDAVLEDDNEGDAKQSSKRRRLTLLDTDADAKDSLFKTAASLKPKVGYRVLDPVQRLVDDSLQKVHAGEVSIAQHMKFVSTDPSLASQSRRWLAWCHSSLGNLLHACAAWNDVEMASEVLTRDLEGLADAVDQQGLTPYEVAELSGHQHVCEVLEAFGADTSNYVFDIYCLDDGDENDKDESESKDIEPMSLELQGGVGYWNEEGQLILEMDENAINDEDDHDEEDSNDEGWDGNDYPEDEDEHVGGWGGDDEEEDLPDNTFRNRAAKPYEEDNDVEYDASYGISGLPEAEYDEEC
jgi:hypothetical protein